MAENRNPSENKTSWHEYLHQLATMETRPEWLDENLFDRLQLWQRRFEFYEDIQDPAFKKFHAWKTKNKIIRGGKKLQRSLIALDELINHHPNVNINNDRYEEMRAATQQVIDVQLMKLEIAQLRILEKAQGVKRRLSGISLADQEKNLKILRKKSYDHILKQKRRFSKDVKEHTPQLANTITFFKSHEQRIHFNRHFIRSDKTADAISVVSSINGFISHLSAFSASLLSGLAIFASVLQAIPFIGAITSSIPILIHAAKSWLGNKSRTKKAFAAILVAVVTGSFITIGIGTIATAGIAVGLMVIGTYVKHVHPWIKSRIAIGKMKNELKELASIQEKLTKNIKPILSPREQKLLLIELDEKYLSSLSKTNRTDKEKYEVKMAFNKKKSDILRGAYDDSQKEFLVGEIQRQIEDTQKDLDLLHEHEIRKRIQVVNGALAVTGAILVCIPTPLTAIIGASLLLTSAIIGVTVTFDLVPKAKDFFQRHFGRNRSAVAVPQEEAPHHQHGNKPSSTATFEKHGIHIELEQPSIRSSIENVPPVVESQKIEVVEEGKKKEEEKKQELETFHGPENNP